MNNNVLDNLSIYYPQLQKEIDEMKLFHQEKLWHQLAELLLKNMDEIASLEGPQLLDLYLGFVSDFATKLDQIKLMQFLIKVSDQHKNDNEGISFLENIQQKILSENQAVVLCELKIGVHYLNLNDMEKVFQILTQSQKKIERWNDVHPFVYSTLHKLFADYFKNRKEYDEFYNHSLQYLAYTPESTFKHEEKIAISLEMAIAVLVSKKIYNFSELLEQPILKSLNNSPFSWVFQLLNTFNKGDVEIFEKQMVEYNSLIENQVFLKNNKTTLAEKIRIMAFLELLFSLPKNERHVTFETIGKHSKININDVEMLVMRVMSLNLVKGKIDQIEKIVNISWIIPRVLDKERVTIMKDKIDLWEKSLNTLILQLESIQHF